PVAQDAEVSVKEIIPDTDIIVTVNATDEDGDALTYEITTNSNALFEINANGGISLESGKNLDFDQATEHKLVVTVRDGTAEATADITINVEEVPLAEDPASFITTWTVGDGESIFIRVNPKFEDYDYQIDWGDGSPEQTVINNEPPEHTYGTAGNYQVAIKGAFPAIQLVSGDTDEELENADKLTSIDQWGSNAWQSMELAFANCSNMDIEAADAPNLENLTNMRAMFLLCDNMDADLDEWNVENVTNMEGLFAFCSKFNGTVGSWDVSQVTDMSDLFSLALKFDQDLGGWELTNVTKMNGMLNKSGLSQENYNQTLIGWAAAETTPTDLVLNAFGLTFCGEAAQAARTKLIEQLGWQITGDSQCP
ncbi:MAG: BspA family leucine-rich repeat surface protein, partial [Verrucomicrobiota bacterium]